MEIQIVDDTALSRRDSSSPTVSTSVCARPWCVADAFLLQTIVPLRNSEDEEEEERRRRRGGGGGGGGGGGEQQQGVWLAAMQKQRGRQSLLIYLFILGAMWGGDTQRQGTTVLLFREIWIIEQ